MSAMLYWSAASHSRSFKRSLSTCAQFSFMYQVLLLVKGLQLGFTAHSRVGQVQNAPEDHPSRVGRLHTWYSLLVSLTYLFLAYSICSGAYRTKWLACASQKSCRWHVYNLLSQSRTSSTIHVDLQEDLLQHVGTSMLAANQGI